MLESNGCKVWPCLLELHGDVSILCGGDKSILGVGL